MQNICMSVGFIDWFHSAAKKPAKEKVTKAALDAISHNVPTPPSIPASVVSLPVLETLPIIDTPAPAIDIPVIAISEFVPAEIASPLLEKTITVLDPTSTLVPLSLSQRMLAKLTLANFAYVLLIAGAVACVAYFLYQWQYNQKEPDTTEIQPEAVLAETPQAAEVQAPVLTKIVEPVKVGSPVSTNTSNVTDSIIFGLAYLLCGYVANFFRNEKPVAKPILRSDNDCSQDNLDLRSTQPGTPSAAAESADAQAACIFVGDDSARTQSVSPDPNSAQRVRSGSTEMAMPGSAVAQDARTVAGDDDSARIQSVNPDPTQRVRSGSTRVAVPGSVDAQAARTDAGDDDYAQSVNPDPTQRARSVSTGIAVPGSADAQAARTDAGDDPAKADSHSPLPRVPDSGQDGFQLENSQAQCIGANPSATNSNHASRRPSSRTPLGSITSNIFLPGHGQTSPAAESKGGKSRSQPIQNGGGLYNIDTATMSGTETATTFRTLSTHNSPQILYGFTSPVPYRINGFVIIPERSLVRDTVDQAHQLVARQSSDSGSVSPPMRDGSI